MMGNQFVYGVIPFKTKREKDFHWRQLRREHGEDVKIRVEDGLLVYKYVDLAM